MKPEDMNNVNVGMICVLDKPLKGYIYTHGLLSQEEREAKA